MKRSPPVACLGRARVRNRWVVLPTNLNVFRSNSQNKHTVHSKVSAGQEIFGKGETTFPEHRSNSRPCTRSSILYLERPRRKPWQAPLLHACEFAECSLRGSKLRSPRAPSPVPATTESIPYPASRPAPPPCRSPRCHPSVSTSVRRSGCRLLRRLRHEVQRPEPSASTHTCYPRPENTYRFATQMRTHVELRVRWREL